MNTKNFPGFMQSLLFLVGIMVMIITASIVVHIADLVFTTSLATNPFCLGIINLISIGFFLALSALFLGKRWKYSFPLTLPTPKLYLPVTLAVLGSGLLLSELDNVFRYFVPMPEEFAQFFL